MTDNPKTLRGYVDVLTDAENFCRRAGQAVGRLSCGVHEDRVVAKANIHAAIARLEGALAALEEER